MTFKDTNKKVIHSRLEEPVTRQSFTTSFFLLLGRHMLPSHASAKACLTGWPNVQPQGRD